MDRSKKYFLEKLEKNLNIEVDAKFAHGPNGSTLSLWKSLSDLPWKKTLYFCISDPNRADLGYQLSEITLEWPAGPGRPSGPFSFSWICEIFLKIFWSKKNLKIFKFFDDDFFSSIFLEFQNFRNLKIFKISNSKNIFAFSQRPMIAWCH